MNPKTRVLTKSFSAVLIALLLPAITRAGSIDGRVVKVIDGDTVVISDATGQFKIRIAGIDAPEQSQRFSYESRKHLLTLVYGKPARVLFHKVDPRGRLVGKILVDDADVGLAQLRAGYAWHYKFFENEQTEADRATYAAAELDARSRRAGIWGINGELAPWDFRYKSRKAVPVVPSQRQSLDTISPSDRIVANKRSGIYHELDCPGYSAVSQKNRVYFPSRVEAERAGYRRAKNCPDRLD